MGLVKKASAKKKFEYKPLTTEYMAERKNQQGSDRDSYVASHVKFFSPAAGDNTVRILPGTWETDVPAYGFEVFVHYGVGPDSSAYLCPKSMKDEDCPICEERAVADKAGDAEYAKSLKPNKRIAVYVIDRAKEGEGPKLWTMPWTLERETAAQAIDKKTSEVIQFVSPDEGYDLSFTKQGKDAQTKYVGVSFDRKPSPLSDDEDTAQAWLDFIVANPIPDQLVYFDAEHIAEAFNGGKEKPEAGDAKEPAAAKGKPKFGKKKTEPVLPSWDDVHALDEDGLTALTEEHSIDMAGKEFNSMDEAADAICEALSIEKPAEEAPAKPKGKLTLGKKKEEPAEEEPSADELPSYEEVMALDEDGVVELATAKEVDMDKEFDNLDAAKAYLAEQLGIEKPAAKKGGLSGLKKKAK